MKSVFYASVVSLIVIISCDSPESVGITYEEQVVSLKGVSLNGKLDQPVNRLFLSAGFDGLTNAEFLSLFGPSPKEKATASEISVIVDMSAGLNIGIDQSYSAMNALVTNIDPALPKNKYFHADDSDELESLDIVKSISDAVKLQNPSNFVRQYSKLKPAFDHATSNPNRISIIVTDFLLDEGDATTPRRFKDGSYKSGETADNTTWAKEYFTKWFQAGHNLLIYPYQYKATNYYRKAETKFIYYMIFIPDGIYDNDVEKLINYFSRSFDKEIKIYPKQIIADLEVDNLLSCNENYKTLRNSYNSSHASEFPNIVNITFSHVALQGVDSPVVAACDIEVENGSPFEVSIMSKTIDASSIYYDVLRKEKEQLRQFDSPFSSISEIDHVQLEMTDDDEVSLLFNEDVVKLNYLSKYQGLDRLLATALYAGDFRIDELPSELSWDFESKYGTLQNNALSESIRLALEQYTISNTEQHLGTIFFSIHHK